MTQEKTDNKMLNNTFWKLRKVHGRSRIFDNAEELLTKANEYFTWCDANPWRKVELVKHQGTAKQENVPLGRPYSIDGFCSFLGVSSAYIRTAKKELTEKKETENITPEEAELLDTIELIEQFIRNQQIEGATVGVFSASIVARVFGLADKQDITNNQPIVSVSVRDEETAKNMAKLNNVL